MNGRRAVRVGSWATATALGLVLASGFAQAEPPTSVTSEAALAQAERSHEPTASPRRSPSSRPSASARPTRSPKPKPSEDERRRDDRRRRAGRVLHGETVVATEDGRTVTRVVQRGVVTAVRGRTFTVRSSDGYTLTWTRDAETRVRSGEGDRQREVAVGDDVLAHGVRHDARTVVAKRVRIRPGEDRERG